MAPAVRAALAVRDGRVVGARGRVDRVPLREERLVGREAHPFGPAGARAPDLGLPLRRPLPLVLRARARRRRARCGFLLLPAHRLRPRVSRLIPTPRSRPSELCPTSRPSEARAAAGDSCAAPCGRAVTPRSQRATRSPQRRMDRRSCRGSCTTPCAPRSQAPRPRCSLSRPLVPSLRPLGTEQTPMRRDLRPEPLPADSFAPHNILHQNTAPNPPPPPQTSSHSAKSSA